MTPGEALAGEKCREDSGVQLYFLNPSQVAFPSPGTRRRAMEPDPATDPMQRSRLFGYACLDFVYAVAVLMGKGIHTRTTRDESGAEWIC